MVFFTCNHCGESAKKPAVEKHYNTKCRGAPIFISCMDCQKDFRDQEYVEHTKCISEAEKYSGKGYVPKESLNKGQKKQDSWLEIVRSILTTTEYNLNPAVKIIFQRLQSYDNVPRKGSKFENFVSNSMRINKNQAKEVWKILEMELNKLKKSNLNSNTTTTNGNVKESNGNTENGDATKLTTEPIEANDDNKLKKNKKSKKRSLEDNNSIELNNVSVDTEILEEPKKKKKKSKNGEIVEETGLNNPSTELINSAVDNEISEEPKKKKNKSKNVQIVEETELNNSVMDKEITEEPKKKKSKNGSHLEENGMLKEINTNGKTNIGKKGKFSWFDVISECAKDGISVDKLKKKVIKKHESIVGHNESTNLNKLEKTFKKYLKKSGLNIDNDIIKIIG